VFDFPPLKPSTIILLLATALIVRLACFLGYMQYEHRYHQADSSDYHSSAVLIANGYGMTRLDKRPIFWRTPGYPAYLAMIYNYLGAPTHLAIEYAPAQIWWALIIQIIFCSILPLLIAWLAWLLTQSIILTQAAAWISVFHPGYVLASTYLLTDGPAQILFMLFLINFFIALMSYRYHTFSMIICALVLGLYTWMRPMGQFISLLASGIYATWSPQARRNKIISISIFMLCFMGSLMPWIIRNYRLSEQPFFCPLFGLYLNVFSAPKIKARIEHIPLAQAHHDLTIAAGHEHYKIAVQQAQTGLTRCIVGENVAMLTAWPWIRDYPGYFLYDWMVESCKTAFDLYSYQFVLLHHNEFKHDPLVEYLPQKLADVLHARSLPWYMRTIAWIELFLNLVLWIGILYGCYAWVRFFNPRTRAWWAASALFAACVCLQTGGFGYARLRLPIEPLILICGLYGLLTIYRIYDSKCRTPAQYLRW
jgi:hypothetical protein